MPRLIAVQGLEPGRIFNIASKTKIGRFSANDIVIPSDQVSRWHAEITSENDDYVLADLDSRNGVLLNGRKVEKSTLASGDLIEIGNVVLRFEMDEVNDFPTQPIDVESDRDAAPDQPEQLASGEQVLFSEDAADSAQYFAELREQLRASNRKLKALYDVSDAIHGTFKFSELLHKILELVLDIFQAERGVVMLYGHDAKLRPAAVCNRQKTTPRLAVSRTVVDYVARNVRSVMSADALSDPRFDASDSVEIQSIRSVMCVPLASKGKSQGVLYVDNLHGINRFTKSDLRLLTIVARQAATAIDNARSYSNLNQEREELRRQVSAQFKIVGKSRKLAGVIDQAMQVAPTDATVLITGETGAGKELVARAIHQQSPRKDCPFVVINCASVPETLLESELFGHEKGAFTGAHRARAGRFELANRGTLFLDEIGEISPIVQSKLLRAVESKEFDRVGGDKPITVDVRIVAATNRNLQQLVSQGKFREDLYYRLAVVTLNVPPLRERVDDIPVLAAHFLDAFAREIGRRVPVISDEALQLMLAYSWQGNIRELRNAMERAILLNRTGTITAEDLPPGISVRLTPGAGELQGTSVNGAPAGAQQPPDALFPMSNAVEAAERRAIREALRQANNVKSKAAELLGVSRPTLDKKLQDYPDLME